MILSCRSRSLHQPATVNSQIRRLLNITTPSKHKKHARTHAHTHTHKGIHNHGSHPKDNTPSLVWTPPSPGQPNDYTQP